MIVMLPAQADRDNNKWVGLDGTDVVVDPIRGAVYNKDHTNLSLIEIEWLGNERMRLVERLARIRTITLAM